MAKVSIEEVKKAAARKQKREEPVIKEERIGNKYYYHAPDNDFAYETKGEALEAHQTALRLADYKSRGLDEYGRTPEAASKAKKLHSLIDKRNKLIDDVRKVEQEMATVKLGGESEAPKPSKKRKK